MKDKVRNKNKNKEFERKFLITPHQLVKLEDSLDILSAESFGIVQSYLNDSKEVLLDLELDGTPKWILSLGSEKIEINIPEDDIEDTKDAMSVHLGSDLLRVNGAASRIRVITDVHESSNVIFTHKLKDGRYNIEFEYPIDDEDSIFKALNICRTVQCVVTKTRIVITTKALVYEVDIFDKIANIVVEIEFKTAKEADEYIPHFEYEKDVTDDKSHSNLEIARRLCKQ